ncbi:MAG: SRPBCC domain-containing protein [Flavobacteriales bacterium]|nr:SRPBCC domain-containing protein [Flavobacteriales bacterium]
MKEFFELKTYFEVDPQTLYEAWLDGHKHSIMTGGTAECSAKIGEAFTAWDGYISGHNIELVENSKIVQAWRTSEFSEKDEDSRLMITLTPKGSGTEFLLEHENIPEGQTQYKQGWIDHYFEPMKYYFGKA